VSLTVAWCYPGRGQPSLRCPLGAKRRESRGVRCSCGHGSIPSRPSSPRPRSDRHRVHAGGAAANGERTGRQPPGARSPCRCPGASPPTWRPRKEAEAAAASGAPVTRPSSPEPCRGAHRE
jgi:hypothetical protein